MRKPPGSWLTLVISYLLAGVVCFRVEIVGPRYVVEGGRLQLRCRHSVPPDLLHKVEFLHDGRKLFQYVRGRRPPFRNYSFPGGLLDWTQTDEHQVVYLELTSEASGLYTCEVSTESPIYTKPSEDLEVIVVQGQDEDPLVSFGKPVYTVGEWLRVNCTSGPAIPTPDVTWLVNGKQAEAGTVRKFGVASRRGATAELGLAVSQEHVGTLRLTCLTTIPSYLGHRARHSHYADHRAHTVAVEVLPRIPVVEIRTISSRATWNLNSATLIAVLTAILLSPYLCKDLFHSVIPFFYDIQKFTDEM